MTEAGFDTRPRLLKFNQEIKNKNMALCEKLINQCISPDCNNPIYAGVAAEGLILNYSQIDTVTYDTQNPNIVTGITMKTYQGSGTDPVPYCAYTCQQLGNTPFTGTQVELTSGTYGNRYTNTVVIAVNDNGPDVCANIIDSLANGKFVVILQNDFKHTNGDNKYQIYGLKKGLKASAISREVYGDNESAYVVTLTEEGTPMSGIFFYSTSEAQTDTAIANLKCECE